MELSEIKESVEEFVDVSLNDETIINGAREALSLMAVRSFLVDTVTDEFEADEKYELPDEFVRVIKVEKPDENKVIDYWKVDGNMIRFRDDGKYRIYAHRSSHMPKSIEDDISLHPMLIEKVKKYLQGYVMVAHDIDREYGMQVMHELFLQEVQLAINEIKRGQKSPAQWRVKRK